MKEKRLLSGNEAIAQGAYEAGVMVTAAYPGTPSTEISESFAKYNEVYCEWSVNEKTALETAYGACLAGVRAMACMKHVGLNVAADALYSIAYTGVNAGLVVIVADDPGMHSSQNEQDTRMVAKAAHVPVLEPSDSQEAKDFTKFAFWLSETYDLPVIVRMTTRISHGASIVSIEERVPVEKRAYEKLPQKYVLLPGYAKKNHQKAKENLLQLQADSACFWVNQEEPASNKIGIITSGISYQYVKETMKDVSILKLGLVYPVPVTTVTEFADNVETLYVVEELEPFLENELKQYNIHMIHNKFLPDQGELSSTIVREAFDKMQNKEVKQDMMLKEKTDHFEIPQRFPLLCPGCPHRGVFEVIKKLGLHAAGDIGCYTLGAIPPYEAMDTALCMGAGISMLHGIEKALNKEESRQWVAMIGDSTFFHTGMNALLNLVYNQSSATVIILDNSTTGMTGHQDHPGTGYTLMKEKVVPVSIESICKGLGVQNVTVVDAYDVKQIEQTLVSAQNEDRLSLIIVKSICILKKKALNQMQKEDA